MKKHTQSFDLGINQDISTNKYPNNNIYWAQNFRLTSKEGLATGTLTNVDGTTTKISFGGSGDIEIAGYCTIRDTLILFVSTPDGGKIYKWEYEDSDTTQSATLVYSSADLDFSNPIISIGRYETPTVQKVYFTDGSTFFKHLNIIPETGDSLPLTYNVESLDLVPNITFSTISLELNSGGNLKAGKVQYAYQMYNKRGSESSISPTSNLISITSSSDTASSSLDYKGDEVGTIVNKSVEVTIENTDSLFERIRIFALDYTVYNQVPAIRIIGEYDINGDSISVLDSGQSIGEYTLEEFNFVQNNIYPKSIDVKDNMLFAANIKQEYFRLTHDEFDSRAFRFNASDSAVVTDNDVSFTITYTSGVLSTLPDEGHEAYNTFNDVHSAYFSETNKTTVASSLEQYLYRYNPATGELGGYGENISYSFITNKVLLDEGSSSDVGYIGSYPSITCEVGDRENYSNPLLQAGYQRDEVYRFSFVPIDTKGRDGFAMWIGDIKFPDNTEKPFITYEDNKTYANILGIEFTVNIPESVKEKLSGYRIVRANRTSSDKTIVAQGLIGYLSTGGPDSDDNDQMMSQAAVPLLNDMYNEYPSYARRSDNLILSGDDNNPSGEDYYTRQGAHSIITDLTVEFNPKYIEFTSPEIAYNKKELDSSGAFIEAFGVLDNNAYTAMSGPQWRDAGNRNQLVSDKFKGYTSAVSGKKTRTFIKENKIYSAREFKGVSNDPDNDITLHTLEDGSKFNNKTSNLVETNESNGDYRRYGLRGVFNLCTVDDDDDIDTNKLPLGEFYDGTTDIQVVIANYKIDKGKSQYGGTSYEARTYTTYQAASEVVDKDTTTVEVYNGDTYINFFAYARSLFGTAVAGVGDTIESYVFFPVESSINLDLSLTPMQKYINWGWYGIDDKLGSPDYKIAETVQQGVLAYGTSYPQEMGDLYRYNTVYSAQDKSKEYIAEPFDFTEEEYYDTRITVSDSKLNGEYIDSWTKFKFNNYIDVDGKHNAITKILNFKNQLYFVQSTGVGVVSVNQRSLIQDNQPGQLSVGTGGILTRFDYITEKSGSEFYNGIIATDNYIYYADNRRKRFNKLVPGKESAISIIKGIDSTLNTKDFDTVVVGFDRYYNEVLFTIDRSLTLVFNELTDCFTSSYTVYPKLYITLGEDLFSIGEYVGETSLLYKNIEDGNVGYIGETEEDEDWDYILIGGAGEGNALYKHNSGAPGNFYSQDDAQDSYLTLIINPENNNICKFDNLDLRTESFDTSGEDDYDDIFYKLEASNNYQEITRDLAFLTGLTAEAGYTYNGGTIKRIGRVWRTPIMAVQASGSSGYRMMDTYLKVTLRYNNAGNTFRVHDCCIYYRTAKH